MLQKLRKFLQSLRRSKKRLTPEQMAAELKFKSEQNEYRGRRFYYFLRNIWGILLAFALIASIVFQFWLAYNIGKHQLDFKGYETFLGIVAGESFVQVVGLSYVIVKCLFPETKSPQDSPPKI